MDVIPYGSQSISEDDIEMVAQALKKPIITRGECVQAFEDQIKEYVGAPYAVAFSNGSQALWAAQAAASLSETDCLLTSPNTFVATASYAPRVGARVEFVDIDLNSGNMSLNLLQERLRQKKSFGRYVLVPVHFAGIPIDMKLLQEAITQVDTLVIEDAAHALGSVYPSGEKVGCCLYSDMTTFSFHPVKNITTGEGGMVTTRSPKLYERLRCLRNSGIQRGDIPWYYEVQDIFCQANMTEFQAALGLSQLKRLDGFIDKRRALVARYRKNLSSAVGITLFAQEFDALSAYHIFVVQIDFERFSTNRTDVMKKLLESGIGSQLHYVPMYLHSIFGKKRGDFPNMERYYQTALTLPLHMNVSESQVDMICDTLKRVLFS